MRAPARQQNGGQDLSAQTTGWTHQLNHLEMIAKDAVSTAALPTPLTTRSARQTHRNAVGVLRNITRLKAPAETAQMTCPASSSVFLCTSLRIKFCLSGSFELF